MIEWFGRNIVVFELLNIGTLTRVDICFTRIGSVQVSKVFEFASFLLPNKGFGMAIAIDRVDSTQRSNSRPDFCQFLQEALRNRVYI